MFRFNESALGRWCVQFGRDAADFIYGRSCCYCGATLLGTSGSQQGETASRFCPDCYSLFRGAIAAFCPRCGAPVGPFLGSLRGCRYCRRETFHFDQVMALGVYEGPLRTACLRLKQPQSETLAAGLAELLFEAHRDEWSGLKLDLVVPVPHHWTERIARSHFASETIGRVLARRLRTPESLHILAKRRRTPRQVSLSPARRRTNLHGAFHVVGGARLDGLNVLVTDDVLTTGTTADRAARELRAAGAARVVIAALARGVGQRPSR